MKYAVTGAAGHISNLLVQQLLNAGHKVTVIGRNKDNLHQLVSAGADYALGSVEDAEFLKKAFEGADAVYTMCPYSYIATDIAGYYEMIGKNYAKAIEANQIKYVVNLSSIGAHLSEGAGPISSLNKVEAELNSLSDVNIKHLRPSYFYYNFFGYIDMIKNMGIIGSNFSVPPNRFTVVDTSEVADVAVEELLDLKFSNHSVRYITSDETGTDEIAAILGQAIGKPDLRWVKFTPQQALEGMLQEGLPKEIAKAFVEMSNAIDSRKIMEDYWLNPPARLGSIKFESFAKEFAKVYQASL